MGSNRACVPLSQGRLGKGDLRAPVLRDPPGLGMSHSPFWLEWAAFHPKLIGAAGILIPHPALNVASRDRSLQMLSREHFPITGPFALQCVIQDLQESKGLSWVRTKEKFIKTIRSGFPWEQLLLVLQLPLGGKTKPWI